MPTIAETTSQAWAFYQAGNFAQAEQFYRQALQIDPAHTDAWCCLGMSCQAQGNIAEAVNCFQRVIQLWPGHTTALNALGIIHARQGKLDEAAGYFEQVINAKPRDADAHNNLGLVRAMQGRCDEAVACYQSALRLRPDFEAARSNMAEVLRQQQGKTPAQTGPRPPISQHAAADAQVHLRRAAGLLQQQAYLDAALAFQQAIQLLPANADAHAGLGHVFVRLEKYQEAAARYQEAVRLNPDHFEAHYLLGVLLHEQGDLDGAVHHYRQALRLKPDFAHICNNLSSALLGQGCIDEAIDCCRKAIQRQPRFAGAYVNLGTALMKQAQLRPAMAAFRQALDWEPSMAEARSNLLFCLNYDPDADSDVVFAEHQRWGQLHGSVVPPAPPHANDPTPERRLRIGYISPDFRRHALAAYMEPVLASHDPAKVEVFCYSELGAADDVTRHFQSLAHGWRDTFRWTTAQVVDCIRNDRIDILVDLAGHTANNRLLALAHKPAPVQATWLGYMNTTGLAAVDYRLTDDVLDPPGQPVRDTEELVRLAVGFCCFRPPKDASTVTPLPALKRGSFTFGSLNGSFKHNPRVFDLWSQVLRALPTARLLMFRDTLTANVREAVRQEFARRGIAGERLDLRQWSGAAGYLDVYGEIDVSLDTFPCTGGVTTCESLWMGVPVLSLAGVRPASRNSAAILARVGLADWAVATPEQYVAFAVGLPNEMDRLAQLRSGLRERMQANVSDATRFTGGLEDAYRTIWRRWCNRRR